MTKTFSLVKNPNGIAHLIIDVVSESVNTLKAEFADEIMTVLSEIKADKSIKGIVLFSGKPDSFVAGADVNMIANFTSAQDATALSQKGHKIFNDIEALHVPIVAAIHGACLGGGLELAMACHSRICSDHSKTALGLPEVQLGLLPGGGGTQRLPRRVGIQKSLDMMLTGKQLRPLQALKAGLVSDVVPNSILVKTAEKHIHSLLTDETAHKTLDKIARKKTLLEKLIEGNPIGRFVLFKQATKTVTAKTKGHYPAPLKIIDCVKTGVEEGEKRGFETEAIHFGELSQTEVSAQLRQLFFVTTEMKKNAHNTSSKTHEIEQVGVIGGGLMGGGITYVTANKANLSVRVKDISHQGISAAYKYSYSLLNKKVKRRFIRKSDMQKKLALITGTTDYTGFKNKDIIIEAVFEELSLKQQMVKDVETHGNKNTIFASNTSSLPIHKIAEKAQYPQNVIGLHYFSPVDKMPLVEIIPHSGTSKKVIASTVRFAKKQGKTPIVVADKAGFYINRILAPFLNEAAFMLLEGEPIDKIDSALVSFGFPVGPFQLLDEVGIDVSSKITPILTGELGTRFSTPDAFKKLVEDGRLGKKVNKGFYLYRTKKEKRVDDSIYRLLGIVSPPKLSEAIIVKRALYLLLNEAARCLEESVINSVTDGDIGAIFGIGFPPFLGGPFRYIDKIGASHIVEQLTLWSSQYGDRYKPCDALIKMSENQSHYYALLTSLSHKS